MAARNNSIDEETFERASRGSEAILMTRMAIIFGMAILGAGLLWRFPLFHVVPLEEASPRHQANAFNARQFAEEHWRTIPHLADAHDAATVLAALAADADQARSQFGRTVGIGRSTYFLLRGEGTIVSVEKNKIGVSLTEGESNADLLITTGPVFGNAVRDAPGLLAAGDFTHSQHFNDLAAELNRLVEERVGIPLSRQAAVNRDIRFAGCVEMLGEKPTKPLTLIPLEASVE